MGSSDVHLLSHLTSESIDLPGRLEQLHLALVAGKYSHEFVNQTYEVLKELPASAGPLRVDCLLDIATFHYVEGHAERALDPADDAIEAARQVEDERRLWRALNTSGVMRVQTLDYPGALANLNEALQVASRLKDVDCTSKVIQNIGAAHTSAAQYADAMEASESVLRQVGSNEGAQRQRENALGNIAFLALHVRDIPRGVEAMEEALSSALPPQSPVECVARVQLEHIYVRLLIEVRQYEQARDRARIARGFAEQFGSQMAKNYALAAEAMAEIAGGARDIGLTRLKQALEMARRGPEGNLRDMLMASVRGYQLAEKPDVSSLLMHELTQLTQRIRRHQIKLHQQRHVRAVEKQWRERQQAADSAQQQELADQMHSAAVVQSLADYLEKASVAAELFDDTTGYHVYRVGSMVREIAKAHGLDENTCLLLEIGARQHDIGKGLIPESILNKPGKFTSAERTIMETHAAEGARMIREASNGLAQMHVAEDIAHCHHEKWDGTGYPRQLVGAQIPLSARITAIADVFDALTHRRSYKEAWPLNHALEEIKRGRGTHFDPELTDIFLDLVPRLIRRHGDLESYLAEPAANCDFIQDRASLNSQLRGEDGIFEVRR